MKLGWLSIAAQGTLVAAITDYHRWSNRTDLRIASLPIFPPQELFKFVRKTDKKLFKHCVERECNGLAYISPSYAGICYIVCGV